MFCFYQRFVLLLPKFNLRLLTILTWLVILAWLCSPSPLLAAKLESSLLPHLTAEEKNWISQHPVIRYGAEKDWAPYDFIDKNGKHSGVSFDMLQLISRYSGLQFRTEVDEWDQLLAKAKAGTIDVLPALVETEERKTFLRFTEPYQLAIAYFFIHESVQAGTLDDLAGKTIAIPKGFAQISEIRQQFPKLKILETETLMTAVQAVIERKADVLLETYSVMNYLLRQNGLNSIRPFKALPSGEARKLRMAVRSDLPVLFSILQKTLTVIPESEKQKISDKWLGYHEGSGELYLQLNAAEKQWLADHPVIRFAGDPKWLPYEAFDKEGRYIGMVAEYLPLLEKHLHIKFNIVKTGSWEESINKVKHGEVDVLSETIDSNLQSRLLFTQAYLSSPVVIVMRDDENFVSHLNQIKNRHLAVIKDYGYNPAIFHGYPDVKFSEVDTIEKGLMAVSTGEIDALLCTLAHASYHIADGGINNVRIVGKTEIMTQLGMGVRKEFAPLVPLLNRTLDKIEQSEKQRISDHWGKERFAAKTDYRLLIAITSGFLLLLALIFFWAQRLVKEIKRRKLSEKQVLMLNQRLTLAVKVASLSVWELDLQGEPHFNFDDKMYEIYGISEAQQQLRDQKYGLTWERWLEYVHRDDHALIMQSLAELKAEGGEQHLEFRITRADGSVRNIYCAALGTLVDGKLTKVTGINWDITRRKQIEEDLKNAKLQAENANQAKSQFLANMSHEIRTPLNAIIGFTELLNEQLKDSKLKSFAKTIQTAGQSLLALINDILDLSKIEAGKLNIDKKACNPHKLFSELGQIFTMKLREKIWILFWISTR